MRPISASITIDAPRERVFDVLNDMALRPAFMAPLASEYRLGRVESRGIGASARFRLLGGGWMDSAIEAVERPHLIREHGRGGRINRVPVFTVWELAEGPAPEGCEVTVTFWTEPDHPLDRLREIVGSSRHLRSGWRRSLARLREVIEAGGPLERVEIAGSDRVPVLAR